MYHFCTNLYKKNYDYWLTSELMNHVRPRIVDRISLSWAFDLTSSVASLSDFWKSLVTNFINKVAQKWSHFLSNFENGSCLSKNCYGYFLAKFSWNLGYFLFQHLVALLTSHTNWFTRLSQTYVLESREGLFPFKGEYSCHTAIL